MNRDILPYRYLNEAAPENEPPPSAVALGVFDGVHRGHQALLRAAQQEATQMAGGIAAALTFDPLPAALFAPPSRVPLLLGTLSDRAERLQKAGAERVWVARFDAAFAEQSPDAFVEEILLAMRARVIVIGSDFRFGKNRAGDAAFLMAAGQKHGFRVCVVPPVLVDGVPARSTTIRQFLADGNVEAAAALLGRSYVLQGTVAHGRKMGRTLGYPTANLQFPPFIIAPGAGVYAGRVYIAATGERFPAAISVGTNPTVTPGETAPRTVEAFLMNGFQGDLYEQAIGIEFVALLRPMVKFDGLDALIAQMGRDVEEAGRRLDTDMNVPVFTIHTNKKTAPAF